MILLSVIIWCVLGIPIFCMPLIYSKLAVDEGVAAYALKYTRYTYPFLLLDLIGLSYLTYAGAQKVVSFSVLSVLPAMACQAITLKVLYSSYGWGFESILAANGVMFVVRLLMAWALVTKSGKFKPFDDVYFFSRETVANIGPMVTIGCQGVAMGVWGWYCYDIFGLMASRMGEEEVGAAAVMRIVAMSAVMIPIGITNAGGLLITISLGAGKARQAMQYYTAALVQGLIITLSVIALIHWNRDAVFGAFSENDSVIERVKQAQVSFYLYVFFALTASLGATVIKGTGQQGKGAIFTAIAYIGFAIPIALYLGFTKEMSLTGLWLGPVSAEVFLTICYNIWISQIEWRPLILIAKKRAAKEAEVKAKLEAEAKEEATDDNFTKPNQIN